MHQPFKHLLLITIAALVLPGCKNPGHGYNSVKELAFKRFIARQRLVDLPINFDLSNIPDSLTQPLVVDDADTLFMTADYFSGHSWGIYRDTSKFFLFIKFYAADELMPVITTFDKHGNKIQEEELLVDGCGADCGYYCNAISNIYKSSSNTDILFYARDSVFTYDCDSVGKPVPGSTEHYVKFKAGSIDSFGHISKRTGKIDYSSGKPVQK